MPPSLLVRCHDGARSPRSRILRNSSSQQSWCSSPSAPRCCGYRFQSFTYAESATHLGEHDLIVVAGHRGDIERFANVET